MRGGSTPEYTHPGSWQFSRSESSSAGGGCSLQPRQKPSPAPEQRRSCEGAICTTNTQVVKNSNKKRNKCQPKAKQTSVAGRSTPLSSGNVTCQEHEVRTQRSLDDLLHHLWCWECHVHGGGLDILSVHTKWSERTPTKQMWCSNTIELTCTQNKGQRFLCVSVSRCSGGPWGMRGTAVSCQDAQR
jgi:hypothetical protein